MKRPSPRRAVRFIAGVKFTAGGDGHYYSEDGRFAVFHMLRGSAESVWELWRGDEKNRWGDMIDNALTLGGIVIHGERAWFKLE